MSRLSALAFLLALPAAALAGGKMAGVATVDLTPATFSAGLAAYRDAEGAFAEGTLFRLAPGDYVLEPTAAEESTCGNCEDPNTAVAYTLGLRVAGTGIALEADPAGEGEVVIRTNAGYGLLFEDCEDCVLRGVSITDGARDPDPNATDAAIVVKNSALRIEDCLITENLGDSTLLATQVVGIIGVAGREGARLELRGNRIVRNSWDGIALYRGAEALIEDNLIDGVDKAGGRVRGGGRGVGIGLTWDAKATLRRNRVSRYWKGIGVFVDAQATVEENVVEDVLTWGIALWDAGKGRPRAVIRRNLIFGTGACGISLARTLEGEPGAGACRENVLVQTGKDARYDAVERFCAQCPIAKHGLAGGFELGENWPWGNRRALPAEAGLYEGASADLPDRVFVNKTGALLDKLEAHPALAGARAFRELPRR